MNRDRTSRAPHRWNPSLWACVMVAAAVDAAFAQQFPYPQTATPYGESVYTPQPGAQPPVQQGPAQGYPPQYAQQSVAPAGAYVAQGNPFLRQGAPRATLLASSNTAAASIAAQPNLGTAVAPPTVGGIAPSPVVESTAVVAAPPATAAIAPAEPSTPQLPQAAVPAAVDTSANLSTPGPEPLSAAPPQAELHGIALLLQKQAEVQTSGGHPLIPVVAWAEDALAQMQSIRDYSCTFKKREAVSGKLTEQQSMFVKSRFQPFSVYMYFLDQDVRGQEAIYVEGRNNGNIVAHPVGFKQTLVGTLSLAPTDSQAMQGNRYPITSFGIRNLTQRYAEGSRHDLQFGESDVRIVEGARVNDRTCTCIQVSHPTPRQEFKYAMTRLYIDNELNVPVRYEGYEFPQQAGQAPMLVEEYTYANLKLNQGFGDADFDPRNPQYGYK